MNSTESSPGSYGRFARNVSALAVSNALLGLRGILFIPLVTKLLGEADYGIWTQIMLFVVLVSNFAAIGLPNSVSRFLSGEERKGKLREGLYASILLSLFVGLIILLAARALLNLSSGIIIIPESQAVNLGLWLVPIASVDLILSSYLLARRHAKIYAAADIFKGYGEIILAYVMIYGGLGLYGVVGAALITRILVTGFVMAFVLKEIGVSSPDFDVIGDYMRYGIPTIASSLSSWVLGFSDRYLIGLFSDNVQVGIYSAAYGVSRSISFILGPLKLILNPTIYYLWENGQRERAQEFITRTMKFFLLLAIPASFGLSFLAGPVLLLLSTEIIADSGALVVPFVSLGIILQGITIILSRVFLLHKNSRALGSIWIVAAVSNIAMNLLLIPTIGIVGAALATTLSYSVALGMVIVRGRRYDPGLAKFPLVFCLKSIFSSSVMLVAVHIVKSFIDEMVLMLAASILAGIGVYLVLLVSIGGLTSEEISFIKKFVRGFSR